MSQDKDSVDHELGKQEFGKSNDLPKVTDFGAGYRTRNLAEDNMTEALIEEEKRFQEKICKDPLIGQVLDDKYHILEVLGFGGMSVVYKAMQEPVERLVAVKTVKFRVDERPDIWRRFEREVKTLSKLSHPNVVTVYDCVIGRDSQPYVVMDYLKGSSLDQVLLNGRFTLEQTYSVASQICLGVGHAHRHEVIHRDIKPANIMLIDGTTSGVYQLEQAAQHQVKVVDFGLAKLGEDSRKLTHSGELWGSPPYMSPEQISGRECDSRADIYSLGCVIYEMLTGKDPFWGANVYELLHCHMHNQAPTLASACPEGQFSVQLENVIARAMAKNPAERFATMIDFKDALEHACLRPDTSIKNFARPADPDRAWRVSDGSGSNSGGNKTNSYASAPASTFANDSTGTSATSSASPFARPVPGVSEAVKSAPENSASASHLLTYTLTVLMLAACILFAVNSGRSLEHTKVRRHVPGSATSSAASSSTSEANFAGSARNSSLRGSNYRSASSENSADDSENRSQSRRAVRSRAVSRRAAAVPGQRSNESVKKTIKDSSPNSPIGGVDKSKFEVLRRLKSSASQN